MAHLCAADRCAVFLWNAVTGEITPATSQMVRDQVAPEAWEQFKRMGRRRIGEMPFVNAVARARRPLAIADARGSELVHQDWVNLFGLRSVLGVPLISDGEVFGVLVLDNTADGRPFTPEAIELAAAASDYVASGLERGLLLEETKLRLKRTQASLEIARALGSARELRLILQGDLAIGRPGVRHGPVLDLPVAAGAVDPDDFAVPRRAVRRKIVALVQGAWRLARGGVSVLRRDHPLAQHHHRQ